jgi:HEPN domain-containing protein
MMDVEKQVAFWRAGALEDWTVAQELVQNGRHRHGLFFAHLSLEKLLKACVVRQSGDLAPRLHNLVRLAQLTSLSLTEAQRAHWQNSTPSIWKVDIRIRSR